MTFDAIRSAITTSNLTVAQRTELRRLLRKASGGKRGPERGLKCAVNHPGVESVWIPRTETRWNREGQRTYHGVYCSVCRFGYDFRDDYAENATT